MRSFEGIICFAKFYCVVMGMSPPIFVSRYEIDVAIEAMKNMADNRRDWTFEQKEIYKLLADYAKNQY